MILYKYNRDKIQLFIKDKILSQTLINFYNNKIKFEKSENNTIIEDDKLEFDYNISISDSDSDKDNESIQSDNSENDDDKLDIDGI